MKISNRNCEINQKELTPQQASNILALGGMLNNIDTTCRCNFKYLSQQRDFIYNPYSEKENINYDISISLDRNGYYNVGGLVKYIYLPKYAKDGDLIILEDIENTWGETPLRIFGVSQECYGISINRGSLIVSFEYMEGQWKKILWSYTLENNPTQNTIYNDLILYKDGQLNLNYIPRIVGYGHTRSLDIENIFISDMGGIHQVNFYPKNGEFIMDLLEEFVGPITYEINKEVLFDNTKYYDIIINGNTILENKYLRQRICFDSSINLIDALDEDILLREINIIFINTITFQRDPIQLDIAPIKNVLIKNYENKYLYKEYYDYIVDYSQGRIIPTIGGKLKNNDRLLINYESLPA